jgi:hypothetical protein
MAKARMQNCQSVLKKKAISNDYPAMAEHFLNSAIMLSITISENGLCILIPCSGPVLIDFKKKIVSGPFNSFSGSEARK